VSPDGIVFFIVVIVGVELRLRCLRLQLQPITPSPTACSLMHHVLVADQHATLWLPQHCFALAAAKPPLIFLRLLLLLLMASRHQNAMQDCCTSLLYSTAVVFRMQSFRQVQSQQTHLFFDAGDTDDGHDANAMAMTKPVSLA
jgi:hypothetical protein